MSDAPPVTDPHAGDPVITLRGVTRHYVGRVETVRAITDVDLLLHAGTLTALVGPSGSGKTTLINLIVGWEHPDSGEITTASRHGWTDVAVVPQGLGLIDDLTLAENIALPIRIARRTRSRNAKKHGTDDQSPLALLMARLGLGGLGARLPQEISLGEQQRGAVARAVIGRPRLLVADEPTAHQDEANADLVFSMLQQAARAGSAVLVATHEVRLLEQVDRIITINNGTIEHRSTGNSETV